MSICVCFSLAHLQILSANIDDKGRRIAMQSFQSPGNYRCDGLTDPHEMHIERWRVLSHAMHTSTQGIELSLFESVLKSKVDTTPLAWLYKKIQRGGQDTTPSGLAKVASTTVRVHRPQWFKSLA